MVLEWIGGDCERHRSVLLQKVAGQLEIKLNRGSRPNGELCADVARFYEVRLEFDRDVRASSVALHVTGLGSSGFIRE